MSTRVPITAEALRMGMLGFIVDPPFLVSPLGFCLVLYAVAHETRALCCSA
jgi:hypothetical protein